ncbi:MAG TPA: hypothetical protein VGI60_07840 [Chthoniobacterales bacterium]|jgi:hypothetical protein
MKKESGDSLAGPEPKKKYTEIGFHFTDDNPTRAGVRVSRSGD